MEPAVPKGTGSIWAFVSELLRTVLVVAVLVFVIRGYLLQPFVVEGESMAPRFHTEDYLLVDKISYRFGEPQRGDIVVFKYPNDHQFNYVKRLIGLPGDVVTISDSRVRITSTNGKTVTLNETYLGASVQTILPDQATTRSFTVPTDSYFVLGDNRQNSSDSREWGFLPKDDMIGRVVMQAYPFNRASFVAHARYDGI